MVSITDQGAGITAEERTQLGRRSFRGERHREEVAGAGLGFWIASTFIKVNNGSIEIESEGIGCGTTASGVGIVKAQPEICAWHLTPSLAGHARRSVPRSLSPNCPRRGAGVNGASRLLAGYGSRRSSGNRSPLRRGGPRSRAGAGVREECSGSFAGRLSMSCWLRRADSDAVPVRRYARDQRRAR